MTTTERESPPNPLARVDISRLTRDAARDHPSHPAICDSSGDRATALELDARADAMAGAFADIGLAPGETLMVAGGARVSSCVALLAGLRAGLNVALAPPHAPPAMLAAFASRVDARAIACQTSLGDHSPMLDMFEVAARATGVRMVCGLGPEAFDGAVNLAGEGFGAPSQIDSDSAAAIVTFAKGGGAVYHAQKTLFVAAIDVARRGRVGFGETIVSCLAPTGFAGLAIGPFLALAMDAPLYLIDPFDSAALIAALESRAPAHLIAPGALAGPLAEAGLLRPDLLRALLLLDRSGDGAGSLAPLGDTGGVAIVDLHAFGEQAVIAEPRGPEARPLPPAREPHMIEIGEARVLSVRRRAGPGPLGFEGEAVSAG